MHNRSDNKPAYRDTCEEESAGRHHRRHGIVSYWTGMKSGLHGIRTQQQWRHDVVVSERGDRRLAIRRAERKRPHFHAGDRQQCTSGQKRTGSTPPQHVGEAITGIASSRNVNIGRAGSSNFSSRSQRAERVSNSSPRRCALFFMRDGARRESRHEQGKCPTTDQNQAVEHWRPWPRIANAFPASSNVV